MFYVLTGFMFICDDCDVSSRFFSVKEARRCGWAVSKDYRRCYCSQCAPKHRNVGRKGVKRY